MELLRNFLNSGENSYFTYIVFIITFIILVFSAVALLDFMLGKLFRNQE